MKKEEILSNLCYYDKRNPSGIYTDDLEFVNEIGFDIPEAKGEHCLCDNCFYGRTKLAEYILKLLENGNNNNL